MAQKRTRRPEVADDEADVPLQAIVLADSFAQQFRPITTERPKVFVVKCIANMSSINVAEYQGEFAAQGLVLLPLVNVPMIDYSLEWLASAGVEEVFVFCCTHAKQVTSYLERTGWLSRPNFTLTPIVSRDCVSAGDALRVIDQRNVIRGDFVLISGDTVSNMPLKEVLKEHQERKKIDKMAVMTMVIAKSQPIPFLNQTRLGNEELLLAIDSTNKQLLHYDTLNEASATVTPRQQALSRQVVLERVLLQDRPAVDLRMDVQDCHVDICSPEVLLLFTDNFDYQHLRRDFVKGLLSDEVTGNKIHTYDLLNHYAASVDNLRAYDVVSKDIIHRWPYPMVPDIRFATPGIGFKIGRSNVYREDGVSLALTASIGPNTVLGTRTSIGEKTVIRNSVIGKGCTIGNNVIIEGSHLWDNVTVRDNARVQSSLLCDGVILKPGAIVEPGVVLSFKVIIGENFTVPAYSKLSITRQSLDDDSSDEELEYAAADRDGIAAESPPSLGDGRESASPELGGDERAGSPQWNESEVGEDGVGCKWFAGQDNNWRHSIAPIPKYKIQEEMEREEEGELQDAAQDMAVLSIGDGAGEVEVDEEEPDEEDEDAFFDEEVEATFKRAVTGESGTQEDHVVLEVNGLKLGLNRTQSDCAGALFRGFLNLAREGPHSTEKELLQLTKGVVKTWKSLLLRFVKQQDDELEVLLKFEELCTGEMKDYAPLFSLVLQDLYDQEVISEDAILAWASEKQGGDEVDKVFVNQCGKFIQWLQTAEEDSDD